MINGYVICSQNVEKSKDSAFRLIESIEETQTRITPKLFEATTPIDIREHLNDFKTINTKNLKWNWPIDASGDGLDIATGLYKKHYPAVDFNKVVACMVSHMRIWEKCLLLGHPLVVLEHDALFIRKFDYPKVEKKFKGILGINDPRGATRKASIYHEIVFGKKGIQEVPIIDQPGEPPLPNGLPGNSSYVIKPFAAKELLRKVEEVGMWPNDALMCRQFFPWLRVSYPYYTKVQGTASSTTK